MMRLGRSLSITIALSLPLMGSLAIAAVELVEQDTKTVGATTITWDSSFRDLSYTVGDGITIPVNWQVDAGAASFNNFVLRGPRFTPKGPDPATGNLISVTLIQDSSSAGTSGQVNATFRFTELHCDQNRNRQIGNAHFSLVLNTTEGVVAYGVNVHVEDPGACTGGNGRPSAGPGAGGPSSDRSDGRGPDGSRGQDGPPAWTGGPPPWAGRGR
jgi:hypothetical protein